ncbi:hypothetical protein [Nocardioides sp.]|uniref:hypothetical protein n=1 Tax=Nocardioides sp. TaxID=35761 RepID=UPI0035676462
MLASTSLLAVAWIGGYNGVGILPPLPTALGLHETAGVPSEPVTVHGEPGVATVAAANAVTGGINGTLTRYDASGTPDGIGPGDGTSEFYGSSAHLSFWALTARSTPPGSRSGSYLCWVRPSSGGCSSSWSATSGADTGSRHGRPGASPASGCWSPSAWC